MDLKKIVKNIHEELTSKGWEIKSPNEGPGFLLDRENPSEIHIMGESPILIYHHTESMRISKRKVFRLRYIIEEGREGRINTNQGYMRVLLEDDLDELGMTDPAICYFISIR